MAMSQREWLLDLYRHQEWADAEHWRAIGAFEAARQDEVVRKRLHHIHLVQHVLEWSVGDRKTPPAITKPEDFASFESLRDYARSFHSRVEPFFSSLIDDRLSASIPMPWFKDPP